MRKISFTLVCLMLLALPSLAGAAGILNFNTADQAEIADMLFGIVDDNLAKAIVDYRTENGPFAEPEDLLNVPGMRAAIYNEIRPEKLDGDVVFDDVATGMHSY